MYRFGFEICKWIDIVVFSDKGEKPSSPSSKNS